MLKKVLRIKNCILHAKCQTFGTNIRKCIGVQRKKGPLCAKTANEGFKKETEFEEGFVLQLEFR